MARRTLLLSFDLEDCDQILARRLGNPDWDRPWEGFERQLGHALDLLDSLGAKATFFVLGMTARNHPDSVRELASRGHDIAAHGFDHRPVFTQSPEEFRRDVEGSLELIHSLTGSRPIGYRPQSRRARSHQGGRRRGPSRSSLTWGSDTTRASTTRRVTLTG